MVLTGISSLRPPLLCVLSPFPVYFCLRLYSYYDGLGSLRPPLVFDLFRSLLRGNLADPPYTGTTTELKPGHFDYELKIVGRTVLLCKDDKIRRFKHY